MQTYSSNTCLCTFDACLDAIYTAASSNGLCPACAVGPATVAYGDYDEYGGVGGRTSLNWQTLFTSSTASTVSELGVFGLGIVLSRELLVIKNSFYNLDSHTVSIQESKAFAFVKNTFGIYHDI